MNEGSGEGFVTEVGSKQPIRGQFVLELSDIRRGLWEAGSGLRLIIVVLAWPVLWVVVRSLNGGDGVVSLWVPAAVVCIGIPALLFGFNRAASKVLENRKDTERDITWELDETGYCVKTPGSDSRAAWDTVHRIKEGRRTFLLYPASNIFQIIPKRAFRYEDIPRIRWLFRTRVTPRSASNPMVRTVALWVVLIVAFLAVWQFLQQPGHRSTEPDDSSNPR